jgi:hypothetical protein
MSEICQICNLGFESTTTNFCTTKECFHNFHTNCLLLYSVQSTKHSVRCPYPSCDKLICEEDEQSEDRERTDSMPLLIDEETVSRIFYENVNRERRGSMPLWQSETQLLEESMNRERRDSMPSLMDEEQYQRWQYETWQSETQLLEESMNRASRSRSDFTIHVHAGVVHVGVNAE